MVMNHTKIYLKMKNKNWLSIEKNIIKGVYYDYQKLFSFRKFSFSLRFG